jgi:hypothetical protein
MEILVVQGRCPRGWQVIGDKGLQSMTIEKRSD